MFNENLPGLQGLLALLWVFLVDFYRRLLSSNFFIVIVFSSLSVFALVLLIYPFALMDWLDECIPVP